MIDRKHDLPITKQADVLRISQLTCKVFSAERKTPWHSSRITACNALIATLQRRHGRTKSSESEKKNLRNAKPVA
jgi:RNA polymerase-interacting CarD/CdnL/TRCF family regulator